MRKHEIPEIMSVGDTIIISGGILAEVYTTKAIKGLDNGTLAPKTGTRMLERAGKIFLEIAENKAVANPHESLQNKA